MRLLGLRACRRALLPAFLAELRAACPDAVLFGWTPGLPWDVLERSPPGALDSSRPRCPGGTGARDWLWHELELLRGSAPVVADAGEAASPARRTARRADRPMAG